MSEIICYNCTKAINDTPELIFCPYCISQIKCKNCTTLILKDAIGCVSCGSRIELPKTNQDLNQIEFEQKGDTKKFKATFSDNVGSDLVSTFGGIFGIQANKKRVGLFPQIKNTGDSSTAMSVDDVYSQDADEINEALLKVFKIDGDKLILQTANFKTKVMLDKAIRISLLTLLASKYLLHQEDTKRSVLTDVLNRAKLNMGSFRAWIGKSEEIGKKGGGLIFLTTNGLPTAISVLNEIINPDIIEGSIVFSKSHSSKRKSKAKTNDSESDANKKVNKNYKDFIDSLINDDFFIAKRSLAAIVEKIKDQYAVGLSTSDISGHMGNLVADKKIKREKGASKTYEYFV